MTEEQRAALNKCIERIEELDPEARKWGDKAEATGDLVDDMIGGVSYSALVFNMARAWDAAVVALGEYDGEPKLKVFMTDPAEIIYRCNFLIGAAEEFISAARFALNSGSE